MNYNYIHNQYVNSYFTDRIRLYSGQDIILLLRVVVIL